MFSRIALFSMLALPLFAAATAIVRTTAPAPTTACCASTQDSQSASATTILEGLGIPLSSVSGLIGADCSPISAVGVGSGSECSGSTVSCSNIAQGGIGIGCAPIST